MAAQDIERLSAELAAAQSDASILRQALDEEREKLRRMQQESEPPEAAHASRLQGEDEIDEIALEELDVAESVPFHCISQLD